MAQHDEPGTGERRPIGGDLVIPVAGLAFTLYYFSTIVDSPWTAQVSAFFVGSILSLLIVAYLIKTVRQVLRREASLGLETLATPRWLVPKRLILLGLTIGYIVLVEWGGFTLTTFAFLWFAMVLLGDGRNKLFAAIISAAMALGGYLLFIVAFETRFPEGPFELLMKGVF